jgi:hypothetical protein
MATARASIVVLSAAAGLVGAGQWLLFAHATTPGATATVPDPLPADLANELAWTGDRALVLVAAHPQCPCLPATLGELDRALREFPNTAVRYLVHTPSAPPPEWDAALGSRLRQRLPAGTVRDDRDGMVARQFGCATSGHVLLYAADGSLQFSGGITAGRGHAGDNAASRALRAALAKPATATTRTAVFGCPLSADSAEHERGCCKPF